MSSPKSLVGCVLVANTNEVLLAHKPSPNRAHWELPGGRIEAGNTAGPFLTKELRTQLGVGVEVIRELGYTDYKEGNDLVHYSWWLARITDGSPAAVHPGRYDAVRFFGQKQMFAAASQLSSSAHQFVVAWQAKEFTLSTK